MGVRGGIGNWGLSFAIFFTKHNIFTIFLNVSFEWVKNRKVVEDILNWDELFDQYHKVFPSFKMET